MDEYEKLRHSLTNQPPKDDTVVNHFTALRGWAICLGEQILDRCPPSRERSLAITHLEETVMWAIKSIAINQEASSGS